MWLSMLGTLGKSWGGRTLLCCVLSAPTSDSCSLGPRPGRRDISSFPGWSLTSFFTTWACLPAGTQPALCKLLFRMTVKVFCAEFHLWFGQGASPVTVCLPRARRRSPFTALHLGRRDNWWLAAIGGASDRTPVSSGGEGPPPVYVLVGDSHVHLQR